MLEYHEGGPRGQWPLIRGNTQKEMDLRTQVNKKLFNLEGRWNQTLCRQNFFPTDFPFNFTSKHFHSDFHFSSPDKDGMNVKNGV